MARETHNGFIQEEKELLLSLKQGSNQAFTVLYERYWKQVYKFSRLYLTNATVAEDVVQDVFVKIWESRHFINENDNFKGLLFIITRNFVFNQHRKCLNEDFYKMTVVAALEEPFDIEQEIEANDLSEYIDNLVSELPPRCREIFNMSRKEQLSYREIASALSISEKTVEVQINKALRYLKKNIVLFLIFI